MPSRASPPGRPPSDFRADQDRLRELEDRHRELLDRRRALLGEIRKISGEQRAIYGARQAPQSDVERLHAEHAELGRRLGELHDLLDKARRQVETKVIERRGLLHKIGGAELRKPEAIREEIRELEQKQQAHAVPTEEEKALVDRLRALARELKDVEAHAAAIEERTRLRAAADAAIDEARGAVETIAAEMEKSAAERDRLMGEIRARLEAAGGMVAEMRAKGRTRAELMAQVDGVSKEIDEVERDGRELLKRVEARREEMRRNPPRTGGPRGGGPGDGGTTAADRRFEELMKRGKISLGG